MELFGYNFLVVLFGIFLEYYSLWMILEVESASSFHHVISTNELDCHKRMKQTIVIQPFGFYNDLSWKCIYTWMKKREGDA